jgi:hypothetical protein
MRLLGERQKGLVSKKFMSVPFLARLTLFERFSLSDRLAITPTCRRSRLSFRAYWFAAMGNRKSMNAPFWHGGRNSTSNSHWNRVFGCFVR